MAQLGWTVITRQGRHYKIGLYHGARSGHLLIHCNKKVMQVDFNVRQSKTYSFFLDDQLYEVKIVREGDRFGYACEENENVDTPLNRARKVEDKKNDKKLVLFLLVIVLFIGAGLYYSAQQDHVDEDERKELLASQPTRISKMRIYEKDNRWQYSYLAKDEIIQGRLPIGLKHPLGFPLMDGDEFTLKYSQEKPKVYELLWEEEIPEQTEKYTQLAGAIHTHFHPELDPRQIKCQLALAHELKGLQGLSTLYHQHISPDSLDLFNQNTYLRLIRSEVFQQRVKDCL